MPKRRLERCIEAFSGVVMFICWIHDTWSRLKCEVISNEGTWPIRAFRTSCCRFVQDQYIHTYGGIIDISGHKVNCKAKSYCIRLVLFVSDSHTEVLCPSFPFEPGRHRK
jgi:hypothetical protein